MQRFHFGGVLLESTQVKENLKL